MADVCKRKVLPLVNGIFPSVERVALSKGSFYLQVSSIMSFFLFKFACGMQ